ncbi:MAG: hypothetical protein OQK82_05330 [Candidatus Pacearchaeota archaeon]|nr:hypothetical protein [Candidatus Pacearchaeota archaeon]
MKIPEINIESSYPEDEKLYEIINKIMEKDYNSLIEWIVKYRFQNYSYNHKSHFNADFINLKSSLSLILKKLKKLLRWSKLEEARSLFETEIYNTIVAFRKKYFFFEKSAPVLFETLNTINEMKNIGSEEDLMQIKELLQKFENKIKIPDISSSFQEKDEFEKKLTNHLFLLKELIDILTTEHDNRIMNTRDNFTHFINSHLIWTKKINTEIQRAAEQIQKLKQDDSIPESDKKGLLIAFKKKHNELTTILKNENNRMITLKAISDNVLKGFIYLRDLIKSLKDQAAQFRRREEYVETLSQIGKNIPVVKKTLETISSSFKDNYKDLKTNFLVSDLGLQKKILDAIESQEVINRIVFSDSDKTTEELQISFTGENTDMETLKPENITMIDLDNFKTLRK